MPQTHCLSPEMRLAVPKALEALEALHTAAQGWNSPGSRDAIDEALKEVRAGETPALDALAALMDDHACFECTVMDGFLEFEDWGESGYGHVCDELEFVEALGDLFEAGGTLVRYDRGDCLPSVEYRFHGGSYTVGVAQADHFVDDSDQAKVQAAFQRVQAAAPATCSEDLEILAQFMASAGVTVQEQEEVIA